MKTLFITYNSALEPLIQSQGIPYLKGLARKGVGCILLSFERPRRFNRSVFNEKVDALKHQLRSDGIEWHYRTYHKSPSIPATAFDIAQGILVSLYLVALRGVHIIHARGTVPAVMGCVVAKLLCRKFIFDVRGLMAEEYVDGGIWKKDGLVYVVTHYIEKKLLLCADGVVVLAETIRDFFNGSDGLLAKKQIAVIPSCVDVERFCNGRRPAGVIRQRLGLDGKFVFIYAGSVGTWYLIREMIDFFIAAKKIIHNAHFLILTQMDRELVKNYCRNKGVSLGDVTVSEAEYDDIPDYLAVGDAGIFFIKPCFSKRSSCPIKFAEYLAAGLPVVINAGIGDTDTMVQKHNVGVVIREFSRDSYVRGVDQLLGLMSEKVLLAERCSKAAKDLFSLDMGVFRYLDVYHKAAKGQRCS